MLHVYTLVTDRCCILTKVCYLQRGKVNGKHETRGTVLLCAAAAEGGAEVVGVLLTASVDMAATDIADNTALCVAAAASRADSCQCLLDAGSDLNMASHGEWWTVLV